MSPQSCSDSFVYLSVSASFTDIRVSLELKISIVSDVTIFSGRVFHSLTDLGKKELVTFINFSFGSKD